MVSSFDLKFCFGKNSSFLKNFLEIDSVFCLVSKICLIFANRSLLKANRSDRLGCRLLGLMVRRLKLSEFLCLR